MLIFECPSCKSKLQLADEHAGKTIQCPKCQGKAVAPTTAEASAQAITAAPIAAAPPAPETAVTTPEQVPMPASDRKRDDDAPDDRPRRRREVPSPVPAAGIGIGLVLLIVGAIGCVGLTVVAVLIALLVPAVQKVREAAARTQSTNNLRQISLAFHGFHDANRRLPFNGAQEVGPQAYSKTALPGDPRSGSWGFQILPFIDQGPLFQTANRGAPVVPYLCPGRGRPPVELGPAGGAWTDYFLNNYINNPLEASRPDNADKRVTLMGITDGTSNTVLVGHGNISTNQYAAMGNVTMSTNIFNGGTTGTMRAGQNAVQKNVTPGGVTLMRDSAAPPNLGSWGGPFPNGALMAMGDGSVKFFPYQTGNFAAFLTPTGGEVVLLPDF